jgi:Domain of unknown function (DUF4382)
MARFAETMIAYLGASLLLVNFAVPLIAAEHNQGVLQIQIKDHREAIDDFAKLNIHIDKILISPKPGLKFWQTGWKEFTPSIPTIDLTEYIGKKTASIFHRAIDAGSFDGFHLKLKNIDASLKKQHRAALVKNTIGSLKLSFQVPVKGATLLVLDLVVTDFSDHPPRGYELGIKGYELVTNGKSIQKIPPG